ncbi:uncharacterized protein LY79DRAFT_251939 [Colletotrichum navitas]|uniref:Uncharacterized protein n=1 Tax=Colletotrichum navitas TaxID=681940 RepID=A0AAD8Q9V8_9PEZI|nr:uncharacterized protein LY79DRAFT_251939 [Colletotrichum navitas]KAK1598681.1 hypothetical protein LY79DRAFT_251939 [Colletotrichum navitas]
MTPLPSPGAIDSISRVIDGIVDPPQPSGPYRAWGRPTCHSSDVALETPSPVFVSRFQGRRSGERKYGRSDLDHLSQRGVCVRQLASQPARPYIVGSFSSDAFISFPIQTGHGRIPPQPQQELHRLMMRP